MGGNRSEEIESRVIRAAEEALARQQFVSAIDILTGARLLAPVHVESWRRGRIDYLESVIQGSLAKISRAMEAFQGWAREKGLNPSETRYVRHTRGGTVDLQFSKSGDPDLERNYRTHYVSPALTERKRERLAEKASKPSAPVVFQILRDSECSECGVKLESGSLLFMDGEQPLCLACAKMDELEYLPAGDAALTRRATKYSERTAVVVRFSRSRGRYERQGILVAPAALERAEQDCFEDADQRAKARQAGAARRRREDMELIERMTVEIRRLFPRCPPAEAAAIAGHTALRGSGRVGRTAAGRSLEEGALEAAVRAAVRHKYTPYDTLLAAGAERPLARAEVAERVDGILAAWAG
ncbi:MAG: DUF2293 domain-containing protein [Bryobacteraceae bacterium]|nr:DUF2293 domain-containing protein [Bryobacteraceae bacterium]